MGVVQEHIWADQYRSDADNCPEQKQEAEQIRESERERGEARETALGVYNTGLLMRDKRPQSPRDAAGRATTRSENRCRTAEGETIQSSIGEGKFETDMASCCGDIIRGPTRRARLSRDPLQRDVGDSSKLHSRLRAPSAIWIALLDLNDFAARRLGQQTLSPPNGKLTRVTAKRVNGQ